MASVIFRDLFINDAAWVNPRLGSHSVAGTPGGYITTYSTVVALSVAGGAMVVGDTQGNSEFFFCNSTRTPYRVVPVVGMYITCKALLANSSAAFNFGWRDEAGTVQGEFVWSHSTGHSDVGIIPPTGSGLSTGLGRQYGYPPYPTSSTDWGGPIELNLKLFCRSVANGVAEMEAWVQSPYGPVVTAMPGSNEWMQLGKWQYVIGAHTLTPIIRYWASTPWLGVKFQELAWGIADIGDWNDPASAPGIRRVIYHNTFSTTVSNRVYTTARKFDDRVFVLNNACLENDYTVEAQCALFSTADTNVAGFNEVLPGGTRLFSATNVGYYIPSWIDDGSNIIIAASKYAPAQTIPDTLSIVAKTSSDGVTFSDEHTVYSVSHSTEPSGFGNFYLDCNPVSCLLPNPNRRVLLVREVSAAHPSAIHLFWTTNPTPTQASDWNKFTIPSQGAGDVCPYVVADDTLLILVRSTGYVGYFVLKATADSWEKLEAGRMDGLSAPTTFFPLGPPFLPMDHTSTTPWCYPYEINGSFYLGLSNRSDDRRRGTYTMWKSTDACRTWRPTKLLYYGQTKNTCQDAIMGFSPPSDLLLPLCGYGSPTFLWVAKNYFADDIITKLVAAPNVSLGVDRGDGTLGTCAVPASFDTRYGVPVGQTTGDLRLPNGGVDDAAHWADGDAALVAYGAKFGSANSIDGTAILTEDEVASAVSAIAANVNALASGQASILTAVGTRLAAADYTAPSTAEAIREEVEGSEVLAKEATLSGVKTQTDKLAFDGDNVKSTPQTDVTLAASQPNYAPAKAGNAMSLTSEERTTLAGVIWNTLTSGLTTVGSMGKWILDKLDVVVSTRATQTSVDAIAAGVGSTGTGARVVIITVTDGSNPLEGARVRLTNGSETYVGTTVADGSISFSIDDKTWQVSITNGGYSFTPTMLTVTADVSVTYEMTVVPIPASDANLITGYWYCYDDGGEPESGVVLQMKFIWHTGYGASYDSKVRSETSNSIGLVSFTNLKPGAVYQVRRGEESDWEDVTIPSTATSPYAMPDIVGEE